MNFTERINEDIKTAMKNKDKDRLSALRDIKSKILLEATKDGASTELDEATGMQILNKLYKQRMDSAAMYKDQGREDLLQEELSQAEVIKSYLPQPASESEIKEVVTAIIAQTGASGMKDMGMVMGQASQKLAGKADGKVISGIVKELLS